MDNRSNDVLYVPGRQTFVSTNNVVFGNKWPMTKDSGESWASGRLSPCDACLARRLLFWYNSKGFVF
jgi:hypothetical protein